MAALESRLPNKLVAAIAAIVKANPTVFPARELLKAVHDHAELVTRVRVRSVRVR